MSASLVGSEMCIRDRFSKAPQPKALRINASHCVSTAALTMASALRFVRSWSCLLSLIHI
eukprot:5859892-Alexandrium_andersonii.AAC.1